MRCGDGNECFLCGEARFNLALLVDSREGSAGVEAVALLGYRRPDRSGSLN